MNRTLVSAALAVSVLVNPVVAAELLSSFEVAEDHTKFVFSPTPVTEQGYPAHGNAFVTQGYIYPDGTLEDGAPGVLKDGTPQFPELVLGTWTCDGWFVGEAMDTKSGTWLISRQVFEFNDGNILVTQGPELADQDKPYFRPITGGTGIYAEAGDHVVQTLRGFNDHMGVIVEFEIPDPSDS